ncbi:O-antigen ligase family protein [Methyloceanibacter sp.]|uniref:O-antigen ligase family protein n=1 Tax=Methyloceanibacter sp. TaxID=1965321 RepID=UPI002C7D9F4B|nr:O-antigen ligase family protein [Methyloceanibacter sp.]HML91932.1 O-antigen ligase family protein [Methyloceanibacter sp.]
MRHLANLALRREPAIIRVLFFLGPLATLLIPKSTVVILIVLFLCCVGLELARGGDLRNLFRIDATLALFGATAAYLFVNATWSLDPERAFTASTWFVLIVLMCYGSARALSRWPARSLRMAASAFAVGIGVGVALIIIETATDRLGTLTLYHALPFTQPDSLKGLVVSNGEIVRIAPYKLNATIAVMLLALWPALLCAVTQPGGRNRVLVSIALFAAATATIFLSNHDSSKVGLITSLAVFLLASLWPATTRKGLWLVWCLAFAIVVPLATAAYQAELHKSEYLPFSARARVTLWAYTAEHVHATPLLGIGASSTRKIDQSPDNRRMQWKKKVKTEGFGWRAGAHAHNAFLQTWYELGAVGVILFVATGSAVILSLGRIPRATQRFALAQVAAFFAIIAFAWGMWQAWLMALTGLAALYVALAVNVYRSGQQETESTAPRPESRF